MRCAIVCVWKGKTEKGKCWVLTKSNWRQRGKQLVVGSLHQADELVKMGKQYNSLKCFFPIIEPPKSFQMLHSNKVTILITFSVTQWQTIHPGNLWKFIVKVCQENVAHLVRCSWPWKRKLNKLRCTNECKEVFQFTHYGITTPRPGRGAQYPVAWSRRRFVQKLKLNLSRLMSLLIKVTIRQEPEGKGELTKT